MPWNCQSAHKCYVVVTLYSNMGKYISEKVFWVCVAGADMNRSYN